MTTVTGSESGGAGGGAGGEATNQGEQMFRALEAELVGQCASCHKVGGVADTPFLGDPTNKNPDPYEALTTWPGVIVKDAEQSDLLTWPDSGSHTGPAPTATLAADLLAWLDEEAKAVPDVGEEEIPTIPPKKPILDGFNSFYLDPLGEDFKGMAVTFFAEELTDKSLKLDQLQIHPTLKKGLKLEHPLFVVYPGGSVDGDPDPGDSFSNVSQAIEAGASAPLGPGLVILGNWKKGAKLSLAFESLATVDPNGGQGGAGGMGGPSGPCQALQAFTDNAQPALMQNCMGCHGGNNGTATNAVDMSDLASDPSAACGQILNRVSVDNPAQSQLFVTTNPNGGASHPFKFGGNPGAFNNFVTAVSTWIQAEK